VPFASNPELSSHNWQLQRGINALLKKRFWDSFSPESGGHRHLNENCDNIRNVLEYFKREHSDSYHTMIKKISKHIPDGKRSMMPFLMVKLRPVSLRLFTFLLWLEDPKPRL
jgi:hypothetical protein